MPCPVCGNNDFRKVSVGGLAFGTKRKLHTDLDVVCAECRTNLSAEKDRTDSIESEIIDAVIGGDVLGKSLASLNERSPLGVEKIIFRNP